LLVGYRVTKLSSRPETRAPLARQVLEARKTETIELLKWGSYAAGAYYAAAAEWLMFAFLALVYLTVINPHDASKQSKRYSL